MAEYPPEDDGSEPDNEPVVVIDDEVATAVQDLTDPSTQLRGACTMMRRVLGRGRMVRALDLRLRRLQLFDVDPNAPDEDRAAPHGVPLRSGGRSWRKAEDHALVQLVLEHRDRYMGLKQSAERLELAIERAAGDLPKDDASKIEAIDRLSQASKGLARVAVEGGECLTRIGDTIRTMMQAVGAQSTEEVKLVTQAAKLAQQQLHHEDKVRAKGRDTRTIGLTSAQIADARRKALERESQGSG